MNCFNHESSPAVGLCKACSKGVCADCATDLVHGLACKGKHEQRVKDLEMVISKSTKVYRDAPKNLYIVPVFYLFMGLIFSGYPLYQGEPMTNFAFVLGVGFIIFGAVLLVRNRKIFGENSDK